MRYFLRFFVLEVFKGSERLALFVALRFRNSKSSFEVGLYDDLLPQGLLHNIADFSVLLERMFGGFHLVFIPIVWDWVRKWVLIVNYEVRYLECICDRKVER